MPDSSIFFQQKPVQVISPLEALSQANEVKGQQNRNALFDMQVQDRQKAMDRQNKLNQLYQQTGGDVNAMLKSGGLDYDTAQQLQKQVYDQQKTQSEVNKNNATASKEQIAAGIQKLTYGSQLLQGATPENWEQTRQEFYKTTGGDLGEYDPQKVQQYLQQGLSAKDKLEAQLKQEGFDIQRNGQAIQVRGQDITAQNAQLAHSDRMAANGVMGQAKPAPGYRWKDDGTQEPIPGGPADMKIKADQYKQDQANKKLMQSSSQAIKDAQESNALINQALPLFDVATGSVAGSARDSALGALGISTDGAKAAAQLKVIGGSLVSKVPKMSGPQSDADVRNYKEMAGQVGNEKLPIETRMAALKAVKDINDRQIAYHSAIGDTLGGQSPAPSAPAQANTVDHNAALEWANANPNDPRAAAIKQRLGQ